MSRQVQILVEGRVQGVFFRAATQKKALQLSVQGFVRNLPDSRVEIIAAGPSLAISSLIEWCNKGPKLARVQQVIVNPIASGEIFSGFEIR